MKRLRWNPAVLGFVLSMCGLSLASATNDGAERAATSFDDALGPAVAGFSRAFEQAVADESIPGAAWAVVRGNQVLALGTLGSVDQAGSRAVDSGTVFRIASVSKGFAGTLATLLAHEGHFSLDESIHGYAPSFGFSGPSRPPLTIQDVLGQRSGFVPNAFDNLIEAGQSRAQIYPRFAEIEPLCAPGLCYSYQNSVFSLIEEVIHQSMSVPYPELLARRIFQPLGMLGASVGYEAFKQGTNRAQPHIKTRSGWRQIVPRSTYYQVSSAAGVNATILDMAHWAIAMLGHRPDVVPAEVIAEVLTPRIETRRELRNRHWRGRLSNAHYGLGWRIYEIGEHRLALHSGWLAGYRAEIALSHQLDVGLVILMNAESRAVGELDRLFWESLLAGPLPDAGGARATPILNSGIPLPNR